MDQRDAEFAELVIAAAHEISNRLGGGAAAAPAKLDGDSEDASPQATEAPRKRTTRAAGKAQEVRTRPRKQA